MNRNSREKEKILLMNLPFWTPLIPAMGIATLKSFLQQYGYTVTAVDAASENSFLELYNHYFRGLRGIVPKEHWGNFYNIGHDVLRNQMMARINYKKKKEYNELVKQLIYQTYFCQSNDEQVSTLDEIIDEFFSRLETFTLKLLADENPSVLGLSTNSGNFAAAKFVFELTRKKYPHVKTVMGGSIFFNHLARGNPDLDYFLNLAGSYIDKIFIGRGEIPFLSYLEGELPAAQRLFSSEDVAGKNPPSDSFSIPDLSDYDLQKYFYLASSTSKSCPYLCSFCNSRTFFGEYKKRASEQTVKEMIALQEKHGHKLFFMTDALLNPTITDLSKELIKTDRIFYLDGYFLVDKASGDIENTLLWRRGGFYRARLGAESGSAEVLDKMGKRINPDMIRASVSALSYAGIKTTTYWVIGHPGETEADFQKTLDLLEELKNDIWQAECNPFTYFYLGQANAARWADKRIQLYPEEFRDMLISRTWILNCEPSRRVTYERMSRFVEHCRKLGIPNPYSVDELYKADERWKKLHKNAVPSLMEVVDNKSHGDERKEVKKFITLPGKPQDTGDFDF